MRGYKLKQLKNREIINLQILFNRVNAEFSGKLRQFLLDLLAYLDALESRIDKLEEEVEVKSE